MTRSQFAGGDQDYLRDVQYRNPDRLARRADLHAKYSTAAINWYDWVAGHFAIGAGHRVLEVGCGAGWLWERSTVGVPPGVSLTLSDYSAGMVDAAVGRVTATNRFASVDGRRADAQSLPFAGTSFDRIVANHMLYHLPEPDRGAAELARVVAPDGIVIAATNGRRHMRELWQIRGDVFDLAAVDQTVDVFGAETGFVILRDHFDDVRWFQSHDVLRCTDPADVLAYVCSTPPAEDANVDQLAQLEREVAAAFERGRGTMTITKDTGCFVCRRPR
jgi:ubiquinone/menaquinone biosynthesis C-methylase UbiE